MTSPKMLVVCALLATVGLGGCASSPATNFYTLSAASLPPKSQMTAAYTVAIGSIGLPDGVDRPQLVVRTGPNQVAIADFERWAGAPKDEIARAIAGNLSQLLGDANVFTYAKPAGLNPDYTVVIDVQRFEAVLGEHGSGDALWQVRPDKGQPKNGRSQVRETTAKGDYGAVVEAWSKALAGVSRDIANAIRAARDGSN